MPVLSFGEPFVCILCCVVVSFNSRETSFLCVIIIYFFILVLVSSLTVGILCSIFFNK